MKRMTAANSILSAVLIFYSFAVAAQEDSTLINKKRLHLLAAGSAVVYAGAMTGLSVAWYKNSQQQHFRFFNDNAEWKQMDKMGHFYSAFHLSHGSSRALQWTGYSETRADFIGAVTGFLIMLPIEILDGFQESYGASTGDLLANAGGSAFFLGQKHLWKEIRVHPKFSFQRTHYAPMRPNVLGDTWATELLKDYNGQTIWLSFDMDKFMPFPKWLNIAVGYGASDMIFGRDYQNRQVGLSPYRQYFLSLDFDATAISTRSKTLKSLIFFVNMIKLPGPTIEFSSNGTRFRPVHF